MYEVEATADMLLMTGQGKPPMTKAEAQVSTEALLVNAVLEGDRNSFGRLYELYAPMVHGILLFSLAEQERDDGRMHQLEVRAKAEDAKGKTRKLTVSSRQGYYMPSVTDKDATAARTQ